jgi:hypothetical protein
LFSCPDIPLSLRLHVRTTFLFRSLIRILMCNREWRAAELLKERPNFHVHCLSAYLKLATGNGDAKE